MSIAGSKVGRDLDDLYVVMHLDEFASDGRRDASVRDGRRLKRLAEMCENLASRGRSHPGLRLTCEPSVRSETAHAGGLQRCLSVNLSGKEMSRISPPQERAQKWKLLPDLGHEFRHAFA